MKQARIGQLGALVLGLSLLLSSCSFINPDKRKREYLNSGEKYLTAGKLREAQIEFQNALQIDPRFAEADYQLALTYRSLGDSESAYRAMSDSVTINPSDPQAQLGLADLLIGRRQFKQAGSIAKKILAANPQNSLAHAILGKAYTLEGERPEAIREFQTAIEYEPERIENYAALAANYLAAGQTAKAEAAYQQAVGANPNSAEAHVFLGEFYLSQRDMAGAEAAMRTACRLDARSIAPKLFLARILVLAGKRAEAESVYAALKKMAPDDPQGYQALGLFYASIGEKEKAVAEFRELSRAKPADTSVKSHLVENLIDLGRTKEADTLNQEILRASPNDPNALLSSGRILIEVHSYRAAATVLQQAVTSNPKSATGYYLLGVAQQTLGFPDLAKSSFAHALELQPQRADAALALANLHIKSGDHKEALRLADSTLEAMPGFPAAAVLHANALLANGDLQQGEAALKEALQQDPFNLPALAQFLKLSINRGQTQEAVQKLSGLVTQRPQNAGLHLLLAVGYFTLRDLSNCENNVRQAIALDPRTPDAYGLLANVDIAKGQVEQAEKDLRTALDIAPNNIPDYIALGTCYENQGRWEEAKKLYAEAHQIAPDNPLVAVELAYLYLDHGGDPNVAASLAQAARKHIPNSPSVADALGWAYYKMGSAEISIRELEDCVRFSPNNPMYQYHLGMAYLAAHRFGPATRSLTAALDSNPKSPFAANIRTALREAVARQ
jgi:tetratricopeptide (TPR) repeat protein